MEKKFDKSPLIGLSTLGLLIAIALYISGYPEIFFSPASFIIVIGGTATVIITRMPMREIQVGLKAIYQNIFFPHNFNKEFFVEQIIDARYLNEQIYNPEYIEKNIKLEELQYGLSMINDMYPLETIIETMSNRKTQSLEKMYSGQRILQNIGEAAPAFGMMGTLVGLVQMLTQLTDVSRIGPSMAIALLTTLYGAIIAHGIAFPLADKIHMNTVKLKQYYDIITAGLELIAQKKNPMFIQDILNGNIKNNAENAEYEIEKLLKDNEQYLNPEYKNTKDINQFNQIISKVK